MLIEHHSDEERGCLSAVFLTVCELMRINRIGITYHRTEWLSDRITIHDDNDWSKLNLTSCFRQEVT